MPILSTLNPSSPRSGHIQYRKPRWQKLPEGSRLIYTEPTEAFFLKLKIALLAGVVIGAPLIMLQLWLFIAPGLYAHEKSLVLPLVVASFILFLVGMSFACGDTAWYLPLAHEYPGAPDQPGVDKAIG